MAAITAQLDISFQSQYTGNHRVYWRIQGSGDDFTLDPTLVYCASGNVCNASIDVQVDFETCDAVTFEGYIQPVCFVESALDDFPPNPAEYSQFPDVVFTPAPVLNLWTVTCDSVSVSDVVVTNDPGNGGYTPGTYTNIPFVGGGGVGAEATVTVEAGGNILVGGIVVTNGGTGYTTAPTLDLSSIPFTPGTAVTYTVNLDQCQTIVGGGGERYSSLALGTSVDVCSDTDPSTGLNDWTGVEGGACVCEPCGVAQVSNPTGGDLDASWYSCETGLLVTFTIPAGATNLDIGVLPIGLGCGTIILSTLELESGLVLDSTTPCP